MGMSWHLVGVLICISLMTIEHLFTGLLVMCIFSLEKDCFIPLPSFQLGCHFVVEL